MTFLKIFLILIIIGKSMSAYKVSNDRDMNSNTAAIIVIIQLSEIAIATYFVVTL